MGHKVHPFGFRLGVSRTWTAKWYADKEYTDLLKEDIAIRQLRRAGAWRTPASAGSRSSGASTTSPSRSTPRSRASSSARAAQNVEILRQQIGALTKRKVKLEIKEIRQPELDALPRRDEHRPAADPPRRLQEGDEAGDPAVDEGRRQGRQDRRSPGRLGGSEMGRREWDREGRIPLGTLRADISYGQVHAHTTYGRIGVKVWIYRGDIAPGARAPREAAAAAASAAVGAGGLSRC